jgi:hypothetical protein
VKKNATVEPAVDQATEGARPVVDALEMEEFLLEHA